MGLCVVILIVSAGATPVGAAPTHETLPSVAGSDHVVAPGSTVTIEVTAHTAHSIIIDGIPSSWEIVESDSEGSAGAIREMDSSSKRVVGWVFPTVEANRTATVTLSIPESAETGQYRLPVHAEHPDAGTVHASSIVNVDPQAESLAVPVPQAHGPYRVLEGKAVSLDPIGSDDPDSDIKPVEWHLLQGIGEVRQGHYFPPDGLDENRTVSVELRVTDEGGLLATESAQILVLATAVDRETATLRDRSERTTSDDAGGTPTWVGAMGTLVLVFLLIVLVYHRRD